jgi:hypothetical protein
MRAKSEYDRLEMLDADQQDEHQASRIPLRVWIVGRYK